MATPAPEQATLAEQLTTRLYGCPTDLQCGPCRQLIGHLIHTAHTAAAVAAELPAMPMGREQHMAATRLRSALDGLARQLAGGEGGSSTLCVCPATNTGGPHAWYCPAEEATP